VTGAKKTGGGTGIAFGLFTPKIAVREADLGDIIQIGDAENRHFEGDVWANLHRKGSKAGRLGFFRTSNVERIPNAIAPRFDLTPLDNLSRHCYSLRTIASIRNL
jgi:hypothetical protein